jgi:hypothetical protein
MRRKTLYRQAWKQSHCGLQSLGVTRPAPHEVTMQRSREGAFLGRAAFPPAYRCAIHSSTVHPWCSGTLQDCVTCGRPKALLLRYKEVAAPSKSAASPCPTSCTTPIRSRHNHHPLEPLNYRAAITLHHLPDAAPRRSVSSARSRTPHAPATPPRDNTEAEPPHPPRQPTTLADQVLRKRPLYPRGDL